MSEERETNKSSLVKVEGQGFTTRSSRLVRRGLEHLAKTEPRIIRFPEKWSIGRLFNNPFDDDAWLQSGWEKLGKATGSILVPPDQKLILRVEEREVWDFAYIGEGSWMKCRIDRFTDLSPLACLKPHDLKGIDLTGVWLNDSSEETNTSNPEYIAKLTGLEWLNLEKARLADFNFLKNLANLRWLNLAITNICELASLHNLTKLRILDLSYTKIGNEGIRHLSNLKELRHLDLSGTQISDEGIQHLANLKELRYLDLEGTQISDEGIQHLANLKELRYLDLEGTQISNESIQHLANLKELRCLNLSHTQISDIGVRYLGLVNLPELIQLDLNTTQISDECLPYLADLPGFHSDHIRQLYSSLFLYDTLITQKGSDWLRTKLPWLDDVLWFCEL
jgi:Leucine-rich repeat (LRR) protein